MLSGVTLTCGSDLTAVAALFAYGEQGGWWDPSSFDTMYQDAAGTTPVTAVGQPVGRINDKSGRGNHRTQATAASRPALRQDASGYYYLEYDGVDNSMATGSVDFSATDKMTAWAGLLKGDEVLGMVVELTADTAANNGAFNHYVNGLNRLEAAVRSTVAQEFQTFSPFVAPVSYVASLSYDLSAGSIAARTILRTNGVQQTAGSSGDGTTAGGVFANAPLYFGRRGGSTLPFNGREYQTIIRGAASSAAQIAQVERFIASRMGVSL